MVQHDTLSFYTHLLVIQAFCSVRLSHLERHEDIDVKQITFQDSKFAVKPLQTKE